jgi:hypothetical protein
MNIEREFPLHVAIWNNETEKLAELIKQNKVSYVLFMSEKKRRLMIFCIKTYSLENLFII